MAQSMRRSMATNNLEEIGIDQWTPFLATFTRENRGAHARVEVFGGEVGYQVETENRPFDGISADVKDNERIVWMSFGWNDDHLTHGVHSAASIRMRPPVGELGAALEAESKDGTKTLCWS